MKFKSRVRGIPILGPFLRDFYQQTRRLKVIFPHLKSTLGKYFLWLFNSREINNFTYDLEDTNKRYLAAFVSDVTSKSYDEIIGYLAELENDRELKQHIRNTTEAHPTAFTDKVVRYGRRMGWYAFVRACKPRIVVETGVDKGLGSCVLASALLRNESEGHPGFYYGTDIDPQAGFLLGGNYARVGKILYGDSIGSLNTVPGPIDLFINDSDHSADYEAREYQVIESKLHSESIIIADNAHATDALLIFFFETRQKFLVLSRKT